MEYLNTKAKINKEIVFYLMTDNFKTKLINNYESNFMINLKKYTS